MVDGQGNKLDTRNIKISTQGNDPKKTTPKTYYQQEVLISK